MIPEGNPIAIADPQVWSTTYRQCIVCEQLYCDKCSNRDPLCPNCPGPRKPRSIKSQITALWTMGCHPHKHSDKNFVDAAWAFTSAYPTIDEKIQALHEYLRVSTIQVFAEAACRLLQSGDYFNELEWSSNYYYNYCTSDIVPREFVIKLASMKSVS